MGDNARPLLLLVVARAPPTAARTRPLGAEYGNVQYAQPSYERKFRMYASPEANFGELWQTIEWKIRDRYQDE